MRGQATRGNTVSFGEYGLMALGACWLPGKTIESGRIAASHFLAGEGRIYIRAFPHKSVSSIPLETRMGKGKGEPEFWAAVVRPGTVIYEIGGVPEDIAKAALTRIAYKMPVRTKFVRRRQMV